MTSFPPEVVGSLSRDCWYGREMTWNGADAVTYKYVIPGDIQLGVILSIQQHNAYYNTTTTTAVAVSNTTTTTTTTTTAVTNTITATITTTVTQTRSKYQYGVPLL